MSDRREVLPEVIGVLAAHGHGDLAMRVRELMDDLAARPLPSGDLREAVEVVPCPNCGGTIRCVECGSERFPPILAHDSLQHELNWLYSQEQNVDLSSFCDAGWRLRLGDETNGFTSNDRFDSLVDVVEFLRERRITPPTETT